MISEVVVTIMIIALLAIISFIIWAARRGNVQLIHKLYFVVSGFISIWILGVIGVHFTDPGNIQMLSLLDSIMYLGCAFCPVMSLLIALTFTKGWDRLPKACYLLFIIPVITNIVAWTNPLHHLMYQHFSIYSSEVVFGPYMYVSGVYSYGTELISIVIMLNFALHSKNRLYVKQALLFSIGSFIPGVINTLATFKICNLSVAATPLGFIGTVLFHGLAIYYFHMLDIRPIAMQRVLDWITDCYLVTNSAGLIVDYNKAFHRVFGAQYGIEGNTYLKDYVRARDVDGKTAIYNLLTGIDACRKAAARISYEQAIYEDGEKSYYMVDITPLIVKKKQEGFVCILKDVTKVKESMQRLQDSQARMMEQERLASLGQMVGGLAHNLKTPIMSISGSSVALENLVDECRLSIGDSEVTAADYQEIYAEMMDWLLKTREACNYMSDIITAVKGQAANMNASEGGEFSLADLLKRVTLLLRHEIVASGCKLKVVDEIHREISLQGDINNLVQVVNNLVSNALFAQKGMGGEVLIRIKQTESALLLTVEDRGVGVPEDIKNRLFKQMITNKGAQGTGLGVYISNTVVRAKFGGSMWMEDNPGGGTVFGVSIPLEYVTFREERRREGSDEKE